MSSKATQFDSLGYSDVQPLVHSSSKRQRAYQTPVLHDYIDIESNIDLDKLRRWCTAHWFATFQKAMLHRNLMTYHTCCNSFSRRHFSRLTNHPKDETFDIHKLPDFKTIGNGDDLYRWQLNIAKENNRSGLRTLFPTLNLKICQCADNDFITSEDTETNGMLRKRCSDLEKQLDDSRRMVNNMQYENSRLLRSSKTWHQRYEELLEQRNSHVEFMVTPVKQKLSNLILFSDDNYFCLGLSTSMFLVGLCFALVLLGDGMRLADTGVGWSMSMLRFCKTSLVACITSVSLASSTESVQYMYLMLTVRVAYSRELSMIKSLTSAPML